MEFTNVKEIIAKTFNIENFLVSDYREYTHKLADRIDSDLFNRVVEDHKTDKFRTTLKKLFGDLENGNTHLSSIEECVYEYMFNENTNINSTERFNVALFYMFIWLEEDFPVLFNNLNITRYSTEAKVGKFSYPIEILEFELEDEHLVIWDMDAIDCVENIIKKASTRDHIGNACTFDSPFEKLFLVEEEN